MAELLLSLTESDSAAEFKLSDDNIIRVFDISSGTGSTVLYGKHGATRGEVTVNETAAQVKALSRQLFLVTVSGSAQYISSKNVIRIASEVDGSGAVIEYNAEGAMNTYIVTSETKDVLQDRINDLESADSASFAVTAVNRTLNTFTVAGDQTATFTNGKIFTVISSTGNDGTYSVSSSAFGAATVITVNEDFTNGTADGKILIAV